MSLQLRELQYPFDHYLNENISIMLSNFSVFKYLYDKEIVQDRLRGRRRTIKECIDIII